jgi:hypothetical protein
MYDPRYVLRSFDSLDQNAKVAILQSMLESLILADTLYLKQTPATPLLYEAGLRYEPEEIGHDDWRDIPAILDHKGGDCEDLACYRVAELRLLYGENANPYITYSMVHSARHGVFCLYHIRVARADGTIEDPSKILGMS